MRGSRNGPGKAIHFMPGERERGGWAGRGRATNSSARQGSERQGAQSKAGEGWNFGLRQSKRSARQQGRTKQSEAAQSSAEQRKERQDNRIPGNWGRLEGSRALRV